MADKDDLTRLEDLSEFHHEEDPESEQFLEEEASSEDFPPDFSSEPQEEEQPPVDLPTEEETDFQDSSFSDGEDNWQVEEEEDLPSFEEAPPEEDAPPFEEDLPSFEEAPPEENLPSFEEAPPAEDLPSFEAAPPEEDPPSFEEEPEEDYPEPVTQAPPPEERPEPPKTYEKFEEVKSFAENITMTKIGSGANPPYTLIIQGIKSRGNADRIYSILEEYGLITPQNKKEFETGLNLGKILISHVSEFAAIFIAHKLRQHCLQILFGLSDEVRPPKNYDPSPRGPVDSDTIYQNKSFEENFEEVNKDHPIILSNTPMLEDFQITHYLGIASEHTVIDNSYFITEKEESLEGSSPELKDLYEQLALKLKPQARKQKGNAIVGVNYQLTPLPPKPLGPELPQYSLTCTGNVVRVIKREKALE